MQIMTYDQSDSLEREREKIDSSTRDLNSIELLCEVNEHLEMLVHLPEK